MEEPKKPEKRRFVRVELIVPVKYRSFRNDSIFQSNFNVGRSRDISVGGLKFAVAKHNPVNTKLDMELELPDALSAYVTGKVVGGEDVVVNGIVHRFDRITFLEMDKEVQDLIMRQVFESMRRKRTK
jgi:c-di-GMP-binding flagellar brake protein YcgR